MPPAAVATPTIMRDPGYLFIAPVGTADPTETAAGSKFTDVWPAAYLPLGATEDGSQFSYQTTVEPITVAEFLDPIVWSTTARQGSMAFNLASWTLQNWSRALNQGAGSLTGLTPLSGTGATAIYDLTPPSPGNEVRVKLAWESLDNTARIYMYQTINGAQIQSAFKKAPDKAVIPFEFQFEVPSSGIPFRMRGTQTRNV